MAVLLSLRDVKNLIHVRLGLFGIELNENTQRNSKQSRTKRKERESRHLGFKRKCIMGLLPPQGFRYSSNSRQSELARILRKVLTVEIYSLTVNIEKISICLNSSLAAVFWIAVLTAVALFKTCFLILDIDNKTAKTKATWNFPWAGFSQKCSSRFFLCSLDNNVWFCIG